MSESIYTESSLQEISPTRTVAGDAFKSGTIDIPFSIGAPSGWIPSKSYLRIELELYGIGAPQAAAGTQPTVKEQIAFADDCCGSLFSNIYMKGGGSSFSSINQYSGVGSAIKKRLSKGQSYVQSLGKNAWQNEADFDKRVFATASDRGIPPGGKTDTEIYRNFDGNTVTDHTLSSVTLTAATGIAVLTDAVFAATDVGNTLMINGNPYEIKTFTNATTAVVTQSGVGNVTSTNWYMVRRNITRSTEGKNKVYALWQPPCGIFDVDEALGAGDWMLQLTPNSEFRTSCVECKNPNFAVTAGASTPFNFVVRDIKLYIHRVKANIPNQVKNLYLNEIEVQSKNYASNLQFSVPSSTKSISIFVQAGVAGSDTRFPPSMFKCGNDADLKLETLQITYAGITRTSTPWESRYSVGQASPIPNVLTLQQRYNDTIVESGLAAEITGCESFSDYLKRGPYYHFSFNRDFENRSTEIQVNSKFTDPTQMAVDGVKLFVVAHLTKTVQITSANGVITSVSSLQI